MSLNSFFDSIDTDAQFDAWRSNIRQKLIHLKNSIPIENREELYYIGETLDVLDSINISASNSNTKNKEELIKRLKTCNSFYKKLGE